MYYEHLDFSRDELLSAMRENYSQLIDFVSSPPFRRVYRELINLPLGSRPHFVETVILQRDELEKRGVTLPDDILVQVSAFGDRRPTLFVIKKYLPDKFHNVWQNVNLTFFNEFDEAGIPDDIEHSWRPPLPVALQQALLTAGIDLNSIPDEIGMDFDIFAGKMRSSVNA